MSVTGLNLTQRIRVRKRIVVAAYTCLHHSARMAYSQRPDRWVGITKRRRSYKGEVPETSDCSSSSTWEVWDAVQRYWPLPDFVNGENWRGGYTGTMQDHGRRLGKRERKLPGDMVFYGDQGGGVAEHVATYVGRGLVVSHGSPGAHLLQWDYRPVNEVRRYIR